MGKLGRGRIAHAGGSICALTDRHTARRMWQRVEVRGHGKRVPYVLRAAMYAGEVIHVISVGRGNLE